MSTLQAQVLKHASSSASNIALDSTGKSTFGGLIDTGSVGQIKFPATQNSSSDANTLDDYEEGTWTPTMLTSGGGSIAVTVLNATYTKVGRMVLAQFDIYTASSSFSGSAGNVQIGGFPFPTQGGGNARYASMVAYQDAFNVPNGVIVVALSGNGINSKADLAKSASQSATTTFSTSVVSGDFVGTANKYVQASLCYETST